MTRFFDSSAIVTAYGHRPDGARVRQLMGGRVAVSRLAEVEVVSALARLAREVSLPNARRDAGISAFLVDFVEWETIEVVPEVTAQARDLLLTHVLRASDAVQLASALMVQSRLAGALDGFVCFDRRLANAARREHLTVIGD
ncbi:MAG: type II toxin-antitoxin system VapC family toxin [Gemmatimonadaceae bacterium]